MKTLQFVEPTPEQLKLLHLVRQGAEVIRGAAGSGKTTTALQRIDFLIAAWKRKFEREHNPAPVRVLVLTFNRTLRGYLALMTREHKLGNVDLTVATFPRWAMDLLGIGQGILGSGEAKANIAELAKGEFPNLDWLVEEVTYIIGRFPPGKLDDYLGCERRGRGSIPICDKKLRLKVLSQVVIPHLEWIDRGGHTTFGCLPTKLLALPAARRPKYDIIVIDEAQDFSSNEARAVISCLAEAHSITFVLDAAQRIYPKGFLWKELGLELEGRVHHLRTNYRNTKQIAQFVAPLLENVDIGGDDGAIPDLTCTRTGRLPRVLVGRFSEQADFTINHLREIWKTSKDDSVAFLHRMGGNWFREVRAKLEAAEIPYVEITGRSEWPEGPENVALSTMHSAKGLEFDHVVLLGLKPWNDGPETPALENTRRLLAMACGRARQSVILGYKPSEASHLVSLFKTGTFIEVVL